MAKHSKLRTNFFSNPAVQGKIILLFVALAVLLVAMSWVMGIRALNAFGQAASELPAAASVQNDIQVLLVQQRAVLVSQLAVYSVLALLLVLLGAALLSHHIGGPLYHLVAYCRGVARGDTKPRLIRFRKHDIPQEVAEAFNEFQKHHGIASEEEPSEKSPE